MATGLTTKKMTRGGAKRSSVYMIDYTKAQAEMARDALVKSIYVHLFDWVVSKVNALLQHGASQRVAVRRSARHLWLREL